MRSPELVYVSLAELATVRGKLGLPIERDLHFVANKTFPLPPPGREPTAASLPEGFPCGSISLRRPSAPIATLTRKAIEKVQSSRVMLQVALGNLLINQIDQSNSERYTWDNRTRNADDRFLPRHQTMVRFSCAGMMSLL